jgi:acetyl esterase
MKPTAAVPLEALPIARARERVRAEALDAAGQRVAMERVEELRLDIPPGSRQGRLYVPRGVHPGGTLLLYFHGGGFALGDLDTHDDACRLLADAAGVRVLAPEYALAPENPFPAAVEEALAAYRWAVAESERLGIEPSRIAVGGDSAGGNLAAVVAAVAGGPEPPPVLQLLIYPWLDLAAAEEGSRQRFGAGFGLTNSELGWYRELYLGTGDPRDPRCSPLHRGSLAGLPPAWIATAGRDPLRDDGERYAERLAAAGVGVTLRRHAGLLHGYVEALGRECGGRGALLEAAAAIRVRLAP